MPRGRYPKEAIKNAKETAEKRGNVRYYERGRGHHPHFSIVAPNLLAEVIMKPTKCIGAPLAQLEQEGAEQIGCMKMYPVSQQISREIWFSSPNYFRRYFRITGTGIIELGPDGNLLPLDVAKIGTSGTAGAPAPAAGAPAPAAGAPGSPIPPACLQFPAQEYPLIATPTPEVPVPGSSGPTAPVSSPALENSVAEISGPTAPVSSPAPETSVAETSGLASPAPASSAVTESSGPASRAPVSRRKTAPAPAHATESIPPKGSVHT